MGNPALPKLLLQIDGVLYDLHALPLERYDRAAWRIVKQGANSGYTVRQAFDGAARCGCPGFSYRRRCKHIAALAAVGLVEQASPQTAARG